MASLNKYALSSVVISSIWFYCTSIIVLYICLSPHTPGSNSVLEKHGVIIFSYSLIPACLGGLFWWLGYIKEVKLLGSGGSVGLVTSISLLPFYITIMFLGGFLIVIAFILSGYGLEMTQKPDRPHNSQN
jgi:hypothetical protein